VQRKRVPSVCVVGSGPGGFYCAHQILKSHKEAEVTILERLPVPFGLVRYGVAPDHPEVKNCIDTFTRVAESPRCHFLGNVTVGEGGSLTVPELESMFDAVVLAYGAEDDRRLGVPGEDLDGVLAARTFVGWYNGLPEAAGLDVDLQRGDTAVILGQGNVAMDAARILLKPPKDLETTDIADHALDALRQSSIRRVLMIGRRGPLEAAFTIKELREMTRIPDCVAIIDPTATTWTDEEATFAVATRPRKRFTELLARIANEPRKQDASRSWEPIFCRNPVEILESAERSGQVSDVRVEHTELVGDLGSRRAVGTGVFENLSTTLVLRSIGYKSAPIDANIPFDHSRGVVPSDAGRVSGRPRLYVSGWLRTGPTGVIVTTMTWACDTAAAVVADLDTICEESRYGHEAIVTLLHSRNCHTVTFSGWRAIEAAECSAGAVRGKPREKILDVETMLESAAKM